MSKIPLVATPLDEVVATLRAIARASGKKLGPDDLAYLRLNPAVAKRVAEALEQTGSDWLTFAQARAIKEGFVPWSGAAQTFVELVSEEINGRVPVSSPNPLIPLCRNELDYLSKFGSGWIKDTHRLVWIPDFRLITLLDFLERKDLFATYGYNGPRPINGYPRSIIVKTIGIDLDAVKIGKDLAASLGDGMAERALVGATGSDRRSAWSLIYQSGITRDEYRKKLASVSKYKLMEPMEVIWWFIIESLAGPSSHDRFRMPYRCAINDRLDSLGVRAVTVAFGSEWPVHPVVTYWGLEEDIESVGYHWAVARPLKDDEESK